MNFVCIARDTIARGTPRRRVSLAVILIAVAAFAQSAQAMQDRTASPDRQRASTTTLTMAIDKLAPSLDRQLTSSGADITYNVLETPLQYNTKRQLEGYLASSWKALNANTLQLTFRKGITFSDGTPFNAAAFKVSMERILSPASTDLSPLYASVSAVTVTGKYTATITHKPDDTLLPDLAWYAPMVSPKQIQSNPGSIATDPIGTGPYVISKDVPGVEVDMTARKNYWGAKLFGTPQIKVAKLVLVSDPAVRLAEIQSGQAQLAWNLDPSAASQLQKNQLFITPGTDVYDLRFGFDDPLSNDLSVRKAISLVIDRAALRPLFDGYAVAETQPWPSYVDGWTKRAAPLHSVSQAQALIKQAGDVGKTIQMYVSSAYKPGIGLVAQALAAQIDTTGLNVQLHDIDRNSYRTVQREVKGAPALIFVSVGFQDYQAADFLVRVAVCGGQVTTWCDPTVNAFASMVAGVGDYTKQAPLLQQFEDYQDADIPYIPLLLPSLIYGKASNLHFDIRGQALPLTDMKYTTPKK